MKRKKNELAAGAQCILDGIQEHMRENHCEKHDRQKNIRDQGSRRAKKNREEKTTSQKSWEPEIREIPIKGGPDPTHI